MKRAKTVQLTVSQKVTIEMAMRQLIREEDDSLKFFLKMEDPSEVLIQHTLERLEEYKSILEAIERGGYEDVY